MRNHPFAIAVMLLALLPGSGAAAGAYGTPLSQSRWESVSGADACHLVHDVPRFGTLVITQFRNLHFAATLITRRPPTATRMGRIVQVQAPWKGAGQSALQSVTAQPGMNTVALDGGAVRTIVRGLENGYFMTLDFPDWAGSSLDVSLSPVNFRPALREHLACLQGDGKPSPGPSDGDVTGAAPADRTGSRVGPGTGAVHGRRGVVRAAGVPDSPTAAIYFSRGSANVDRTDLDTIREVAQRFRNGRYWSRIVVTGATDDTGSRAYNRALGLARAIEIRNRLIRLGVDGSRIKVRTSGESHPVASNGNAYDRARNRRVDIRGEL